MTFFKKDVIEEDFLDLQTDKILNDFDQEYRFKDVNELIYPDREIKTNLVHSATVLWTRVVNSSHSIYKKIQILEADYIEVKSELDNKLDYELLNHEKKHTAVMQEVVVVDQELLEYNNQRKEIEKAYHKIGEKKIQKGSLNRLSAFWFLFVMGIAAIAELFMYKNVFLSQEIGLMADKAAQDKYTVELMALGMASGFTVMIIWLSHKLGELLRHFDSATKGEVKSYIIKFLFITLVLVSAIAVTVVIRGDMHEILAKDQKVEQLQGEVEDAGNPFTDNGGGFDSDEEESGFGDEEDDSGFGSEDEEDSISPSKNSKQLQIQQLRDEVNADKGKTSLLFVIINIFIVVGGLFLSYETHTSSKIYETIEKHLKKLEKLKKSLEKELRNLDKELVKFKSKQIDRHFKSLLLKAALYDKEVRTYNTYMQIFELKMQLIEDYIKKVYEEKGVEYSPISYTDIIDGRINLDHRKELHHVSNIKEYMIYKNSNIGSENNV
ncbi:hypothetical protein JHD46_00635 [Sulfurimonas sp. SAG-AH-194-C20]|nr:hypothetical protein [Sulfurimonas sp. SAG-AH-194-C20]MDF1878138.1 hypothetical protein [Sulfurimonas sp. SAG-AH-194-C20]